MRSIGNKTLFSLAFLTGMCAVLGAAAYYRPPALPAVNTLALTKDVFVSEQVLPEALPALKRKGFATLIDLRPDGEAEDQPSAARMQSAARASRIAFAYVPVARGDIEPATVDALAQALASTPRPVLLYCRSGRRAARTWSLVEASRPGGLDAVGILSAVKAAGQSSEDLSGEIAKRVAHRARANR